MKNNDAPLKARAFIVVNLQMKFQTSSTQTFAHNNP
jgi:hypothetical protein